MIKLLIADSSVLIGKGFKALLKDVRELDFVAEVESAEEMLEKIAVFKPDVVIADTSSHFITAQEIKQAKKQYKKVNFLAITNMLPRQEIRQMLDSGLTSYLLKDCDKEEIIEAIHKTTIDERFLCGKIVNVLMAETEINVTPAYVRNISCSGITVTDRESDIIRLIAEGLSNKQIADRLCLSTHTVNTHRKNIMSKLGVNNTAGVVLFAVKNNILEPNSFLFS